MNEIFDIYTLIFLIVAIVIFAKLRSVLGRRTGTERPPFDPYNNDQNKTGYDKDDEKIITLPRRSGPSHPTDENGDNKQDTIDILKDIAPQGSPLEGALKEILAADSHFNPRTFLQGARSAYEIIVTAFANGDRKALKPLLEKDVYDGFDEAITGREKRSESVEFSFIGLDKADIKTAEIHHKEAHISVQFKSQLISVTRDDKGEIIDGDSNKSTEITDVWTFARDMSLRDPNWKLVATQSPDE